MYWMYIEFFGKKQAGKDVPKMCRRINQRFLNNFLIIAGYPQVTVPAPVMYPFCSMYIISLIAPSPFPAEEGGWGDGGKIYMT